MNYKFSNQAIGALMMALQKSLLEQSDIVPVLQGLNVQIDDSNHLVVVNPPVVKMSAESSVREQSETSETKKVDLWDNH